MTDSVKAWIISIGIHLLILLLTYLVVFMPPDPPLDKIVMGGGSGVELNFGTDDFGSGDEQSYLSGGEDLENNNEANQQPLPEEQSQPQQTTPAETQDDEQSDENSTVEVPKKTENPEKEKPKIQTEVTTKPKTEVPKTPVETPKPKVDDRGLMTKKTDVKNTGNGKTGVNEGNDVGKTGNKGKPDGDLDGRAYYGKKGTGGNGNGGNGTGTGSGDGNGASMNVPGWKWTAQPRVSDNSSEVGKITFIVKIDEDGKVVSCTVKESTVSPSVTAVYKKAILENTDFVQTTSGDPAPISSGTITFVIKSK
jgi:outer membrane biosynthesis protein TonB